MKLLLQRQKSGAVVTHGDLYVNGAFECHTLEDVVRETKIKGQTAIPAGRYRITMENSPRFGPGTLTVNDVPNFVGVRIHAGNTHEDTEGCPLVGQTRGLVSIGQSRAALSALKSKVTMALVNGDEVWLEIEDDTQGVT
jgi:hypothetical protein